MNLAESAAVAALVRTLQSEHPRELISPEGKIRLASMSLGDYFAAWFLQPLRAAFPAPTHNDVEVAYCALCTLLGPGPASDPPPVKFVHALSELHAIHQLPSPGVGPKDRTDFVQLGLSYASGWRRAVNSVAPGWDEVPWNGTWMEWNLIFATHLMSIRRKLAQSVFGYSKTFIDGRTPNVLDPWELLGDAQFATLWFLRKPPNPLPQAYLEFTHLAFWKPQASTIYRFCQIALEGGPKAWVSPRQVQGHYQTNYFCHGLDFALETGNLAGPGLDPVLSAEVRLIVKPVALALCCLCHHLSEYQGSTVCCPKCGNPLLVISAEPRLVVPEAMQSKDFRLVQESSFSEVREADLLHFQAFLRRLAEGADPVSAHLWSSLKAEDQTAVQAHRAGSQDCPVPMRRTLLAKLNAFLRIEDLHSLDPRFETLAYRPLRLPVLELPGSGPAEVARRNRLLLEDAFAGILKPRPLGPDLPDHYVEVGMNPYNHLLAPARREEAERFLKSHPVGADADPAACCTRARLARIADKRFKEFAADGSPLNDAPGSSKITILWCRGNGLVPYVENL